MYLLHFILFIYTLFTLFYFIYLFNYFIYFIYLFIKFTLVKGINLPFYLWQTKPELNLCEVPQHCEKHSLKMFFHSYWWDCTPLCMSPYTEQTYFQETNYKTKTNFFIKGDWSSILMGTTRFSQIFSVSCLSLWKHLLNLHFYLN